jgi:hypothetical protein
VWYQVEERTKCAEEKSLRGGEAEEKEGKIGREEGKNLESFLKSFSRSAT